MIGEGDKDWVSPDWKHPATQAEWTGPRSALFKFKYADRYNGHDRQLDIQADFSEDGSTMSFVFKSIETIAMNLFYVNN